MQRVYKFSLDKSSKKFHCPSCGKKRFVRYVDQETGKYVAHEFGRCDREVNCGYFKMPYGNEVTEFKYIPQEIIPPTFHDFNLVENSVYKTNENNFFKHLAFIFGLKISWEIIQKYKIGTANYFYNGTIFWQIDELDKVRGGKIIQYQTNGHRTKKTNWVHSHLLKMKHINEFHLSQCLFGLHLIQDNKNSPIAIVESEKTACIMSMIFPKFLWMACGSLHGLTLDKLRPIKDRKVILYPDSSNPKNGKSAHQIWSDYADTFNNLGYEIYVSDLLENFTNNEQKMRGFDLADFIHSASFKNRIHELRRN
ncbi:MAG: DUF6371 domain-containing protein [Weeksellaceae bacterium]